MSSDEVVVDAGLALKWVLRITIQQRSESGLLEYWVVSVVNFLPRRSSFIWKMDLLLKQIGAIHARALEVMERFQQCECWTADDCGIPLRRRRGVGKRYEAAECVFKALDRENL